MYVSTYCGHTTSHPPPQSVARLLLESHGQNLFALGLSTVTAEDLPGDPLGFVKPKLAAQHTVLRLLAALKRWEHSGAAAEPKLNAPVTTGAGQRLRLPGLSCFAPGSVMSNDEQRSRHGAGSAAIRFASLDVKIGWRACCSFWASMCGRDADLLFVRAMRAVAYGQRRVNE
nr:hypothetical protein CFP56_21280 [Quercus suber]